MQIRQELIVGLVSISDPRLGRRLQGRGHPVAQEWLNSAIASPAWRAKPRLIADEMAIIESTLVELVDEDVTYPYHRAPDPPRDVTPEATLATPTSDAGLR